MLVNFFCIKLFTYIVFDAAKSAIRIARKKPAFCESFLQFLLMVYYKCIAAGPYYYLI